MARANYSRMNKKGPLPWGDQAAPRAKCWVNSESYLFLFTIFKFFMQIYIPNVNL